MSQEMTPEEYEAAKRQNKEAIESFGLQYGGDEIPEQTEANRVIKVNLPEFENENNWKSGNGEGCWGYIRNPEDIEKYQQGIGSFEVILMNASIYYMGLLRWGTVILADGRGSNRPVLNQAWITEVINRNEPAKDLIDEIREDN